MLENSVSIGQTAVGGSEPPFVIAEAGSNFNQSMDTALRLIDAAAAAEADAVKFQLFRADVLEPQGGELHEIFKSVELNPDWVPRLAEHAKHQGLHFSASAFDLQSLATLEAIDVPFHKIASSEITNLLFVHRVAASGKPIALATGMCDGVDVEEAVAVCEAAGNTKVILMQCGAMYPLPPDLANLRVIKSFADRFGGVVGFSDHTLGSAAAAAAVGLGAAVFEKHFTLDRAARGPDHSYAMEPGELKNYVAGIREAHAALGSPIKAMLPDEKKFGRREGLYAARAMAAGDVLAAADIDSKRPALGLRSRYASIIAGTTLKAPVQKDEPLTWDHLAFGAKN